MGEGPDRARELADRDGSACRSESYAIAPHFGIPQSELHTEGHRLGMYAVGASDHQDVSVLHRLNF